MPFLQGGLAPSVTIGGSLDAGEKHCLRCVHIRYRAADLGLVLGAGVRTGRLGPTISVDLRYTRPEPGVCVLSKGRFETGTTAVKERRTVLASLEADVNEYIVGSVNVDFKTLD